MMAKLLKFETRKQRDEREKAELIVAVDKLRAQFSDAEVAAIKKQLDEEGKNEN